MLVKEQDKLVTTASGHKLQPSHLRTMSDVAAYLDYLKNAKHENHIGKKLEPLRFIAGKNRTRAEFEAVLARTANPLSSRKRRTGRKRKWLVRVYIASSEERQGPRKNTDGEAIPVLSAEERDYYAQEFIAEARFGAAGYCWHLDQETGRCDCHIFVINCEPDNPNRALKSWKASVFNRRAASDRIEIELNRSRAARGRELLTTMAERQKQKKAAAGIEDLAVQVARIANGPVTADNLREIISAAGHTVTRQNEQTISVIHPDRKKARRYLLSKLLRNIQQAQGAAAPGLPNSPIQTR